MTFEDRAYMWIAQQPQDRLVNVVERSMGTVVTLTQLSDAPHSTPEPLWPPRGKGRHKQQWQAVHANREEAFRLALENKDTSLTTEVGRTR